jgi:aminoglycoside/choline kinase family phosphotransferase
MSQPMPSGAVQGGLDDWLAAAGFAAAGIEPLQGDVSLRRYARVAGPGPGGTTTTAILATYPPEIRATCSRFLRTTGLLGEAGVPVPRILASSCDEGWMLVEDLGLETLGEWGRGRLWEEVRPWFERALDLAGRISHIPVESLAGLNPTLGRELLRLELDQTWNLFLEPKGLTGDTSLTRALREALDAICANLGAETPVSCHRDFMVRNLMPRPDGDLVVLDHQDLRPGPPVYDLASLLNDTIFPSAEAEELLLTAAGLTSPEDRVRYHRAAAQRTLKAVGTYTSFARRGAERHLPLVAPTLARCLEHLARVPESAALAVDLAGVWAPAIC